MTKSRSPLFLLSSFTLLACGNDTRPDELTYLSVKEAEIQNAPNSRGDCPQRWKDSGLSTDWILKAGNAGATVNAAFEDACGNLYIGWTDSVRGGYVQKVFPNGDVAWEHNIFADYAETNVFAMAATHTGGVMVSTFQGTTILLASGEPDPVLPPSNFYDFKFLAAIPHGHGWLAAHSICVATFNPSFDKPLDVLLGTIDGSYVDPIDDYGFVDVLALEDETYRVLTVFPPDIPQSAYVRQDGQGGEGPSTSEENVSSWKVIIFVISDDVAVPEQRIAIEDRVGSIAWGSTATGDLLLAYVSEVPGALSSSKLWDGSAWVALGDEGFSATDFHLLPNGKSIVVGLQEQDDVGSFVGYTVDSGRVQEIDWTSTPEFLVDGNVSSVVLSSGQLLAIGTDPIDEDIRGELLSIE